MNTKVLTINQFCKLYGFTRSYFYKLKDQGKAPQTYNMGKRVYISVESAEKWHNEIQQA
ncbi:MAG: transcriptional regulator [Micavibrio sp.]|nr:transcriptional regulator [Micavibrio sp.]